ncbi:MAG: tRNA (guanosine(46)-N7)-methyltransferase TrmB [Cryomorphaceae bacterium]
MGKNKLKKFAKVKEMDHVIEPPFSEVLNQDFRLKGRWNEEFGNEHPIVLELACGKGEYSVGMGELFPEKNFIGIDIKGARMFSGAVQVEEKGMKNVRFLRTKIDMITSFFAKDEVDEIWILFADPQLGRARKRLTGHLFLDRYIQILKPEGTLHLKCDSEDLYSFTKDEAIPEFNAEDKGFQFAKEFDTNELYEKGIQALDETMQQVLNIRTFYEQMWLEQGKKIKYLRYRLARSLK